ncbi:sensor histidine kinase [Aquibacillus albus]|uniref:histidine kinase n=1 Tax=Aquibacillus albus TaxID=1168171 RepID=A0ABS2MW18_9BACI|nr:histidine kinase [Aquibacillus albus]MBM7570096.1 two-component system sensor histidine kinase YesM [Aquibacillus albus]
MLSKINKCKEYFYRVTLKKRIILLFLLASLIPFIFIGFISYHTINSIVNNQIQRGIQSNLKQDALTLENTFDNLNHLSQQLSFEGIVGKKLNTLLNSHDLYERVEITSELKSELNVIAFTNPSVGLIMYYFENENLIEFENLPVREEFSLGELPELAKYYGLTYYGPHISNYHYNNQHVISALRKVNFPSREDVYVYVESAFRLTDVFDEGGSGYDVFYLFLNEAGKINYSQLDNIFPQDTVITNKMKQKSFGKDEGYFWFKHTSNQGWSIVAVISEADYNKEINEWFIQVITFFLIFLVVSLFLAWLLWKMVYRPLKEFNNEIGLLASNEVQSVHSKSSVPEFNFLLENFREMKQQIWELFNEIELKEKRKADLEVEKLLYQINPHFLMNTLNTVQWMAMMNGQDEIDRLVKSLNKLLHYNLGKRGQFSTVGDELDAIKQYLTLQQIRYDFNFNVQVDVKDEVMNFPVPRFILQPLVENSLYHGVNDDGCIQVNVDLKDKLVITVKDNGSGMTEETITNILNDTESTAQKKMGMGIGLNYVRRMMVVHYDGRTDFKIDSKLGEGTCITLTFPISEGESER